MRTRLTMQLLRNDLKKFKQIKDNREVDSRSGRSNPPHLTNKLMLFSVWFLNECFFAVQLIAKSLEFGPKNADVRTKPEND